MSHRASSLSWWQCFGCSGLESGSEVSLLNSLFKFLLRFVLFNAAIFVVWYLLHTYYETLLWFFTIKISNLSGFIPFTNPSIVDGKFVCRLENATLRFLPISITLGIFITIPLILATSGVSILDRVIMVMVGLILLFLFQVFYLIIVLTAEVYQNYPVFVQKGMKLAQIVTYTQTKSVMVSWLCNFFNNVFQYAAAIGIWIGIVSFAKRSEKEKWIRKLI